LAVFFDATRTTSSLTTRPFHDLEYRWDFGDPGSGTWTTGSRPGASSRNSATGPIAAHVFETPGRYDISVVALDGRNTASCSVQITVQDPDQVFAGTNTTCFSNKGTFTGCPSGAQTITTSSFATVRSNLATGRRLLLRRGDAFDASGYMGFNNISGPWTLGAFGSGAKPVVRATAADTDLFKYGNGGGPYSDIRIVDLTLDGNGQANVVGTSYIGAGPNSAQPFYYSNFLILRVDVRNAYRGFMTMQQTGVFIVDSSVVSTHYTSFSGGMINSAVLGSSFTETTVTDGGEGNMRWGNANKLVVSNNAIIGGQFFRQHVKLHAQPGIPSAYILFSDNKIAGGGDVWTVVLGPTDSSLDERVENFIVERNWFVSASSTKTSLELNARIGVVRNNLFDMSGATSTDANRPIVIERIGVEPAPDDIQVYNNTGYSSKKQSNVRYDFSLIQVDEAGRGATNIIIRNNYASAPNYATKRVLHDPNKRTAHSNNILTNTPGWAFPTPSNPTDFKPAAGSAAIGTGTVVPVWSDFFHMSQPTPRDIGAVNH
jgi:hypothetical protein